MKLKSSTSVFNMGDTKQPNGNPYNPTSYSRVFRKLLWDYNNEHELDKVLPKICLYDARHSFATNLVSQENVSLSIVANILGNSESTCNDRYVHHYKESEELVVSAYEKSIRVGGKDDESSK